MPLSLIDAMHMVKIDTLDLNLLRAFAAVHANGSVSRAADALGLSQPTLSHALSRLRVHLKDPLFVRVAGGVAPTPKADALAHAVQQALDTMQRALQESDAFDPASSSRVFRLHMSDIGEGVFLPDLMREVRAAGPGLRIEAYQLEPDRIADALDQGKIDLAFGYLPTLTETRRADLFDERYVVLIRAKHPLAAARASRAALAKLEYIVVRSHAGTGRILQRLGLADRVRLTIPHFMVIPAIVGKTDLAVILPLQTAQLFSRDGAFRVLRPDLGTPDFAVSLHWSRRFEHDSANRWLRETTIRLFTRSERRNAATSGADRAT
jgi:DNA-binding transcriptional LysR family regulator